MIQTLVKNTFLFLVLIALLSFSSCQSKAQTQTIVQKTKGTITTAEKQLVVGAQRFDEYINLLRNKRVGIVANQTSIVKSNVADAYTHLVDTLLSQEIKIVKVFSPEHGFRGTADAGELVDSNIDAKTSLPIISLYGSNKKPKTQQLKDVDLMLFDLQDVGVRFYTYISTLHYVLEACAQQNIPVIVLDRPNPNAHYIDGPVLEPKFNSFVGLHPVPVVYGMSIGEYALMINGEHWLNGGVACDLTIIPIDNYSHHTAYDLPVKPSPNLPNAKAVNLYPSLCFFEGTSISCGRGTNKQFQIFGAPDLPKNTFDFTFTPQPNLGSKHPKHQGQACFGTNLTEVPRLSQLNLSWLLDAFAYYPNKQQFFTSYFNTLAGTGTLKEQIKLGYSEEDIRKTWQPALNKFKKIREKYLLYP